MQFDNNIANEIIGKYILVGITYLNSNGERESQVQLHGIVEKASESEGILIKLQGAHEGEKCNMPPDTSSIVPANPGTYQLNSTSEEIENPDYLCTWEVHKSEDDQN